MNDWAVYREDYNGNEFLVKIGLTEDEADQLASHYLELGHHQHYWTDKQPKQTQDFTELLKEMVEAGSSSALAIQVLISQGATKEQCVTALGAVCKLEPEEALEIVRSQLEDGS